MNEAWQTVRIFVSSTFRDMHAERDYLVRTVFPELRDRCASRQLQLVDVDLRWGITEADAENGRVLPLCLDEVDRCRPYFIGLLGERYGTPVPPDTIPEDATLGSLERTGPGSSLTALEIYHGVIRDPAMRMRAVFYFRDPAFIQTMPAAVRADFESESPLHAGRLATLKGLLRGFRVRSYSCTYTGLGADGMARLGGLEAFGAMVLEDIWEAIAQEHPISARDNAEGDLAAERRYHDAFIERGSRRFIGRRNLLDRLNEYVASAAQQPMIVTGTAGVGKSALLAAWVREHVAAHPDVIGLAHFIGVSPGSRDLRRTLRRVCLELSTRLGIDEQIPEALDALTRTFPALLQHVGNRRMVVVVDALDQLQDTSASAGLAWLPSVLPPGVKIIVSALPGEWLTQLRATHPPPGSIEVSPLAVEERRALVRTTLAEYRKQLDERPSNNQMALLVGKDSAGTPLYLVAACEELRVFGIFEALSGRIRALPRDTAGLFAQVLERLESDHGAPVVRHALSLIACARGGLPEPELLDLLGTRDAPLARLTWARLYRAMQFYLAPPDEHGSARIDFFHGQLRQAVKQKYLANPGHERAAHRELAEYFRAVADRFADGTWVPRTPRSISELPHHVLNSNQWNELQHLLSYLGFIEAKCRVGLVHGLIDDYAEVLREDIVPRDVRAAVTPFARFVRGHAHAIERRPTLVFGLAMNQPADSLVAHSARAPLHRGRKRRPWMRRLNPARPNEACVLTIDAFPGDTAYLAAFVKDTRQVFTTNLNGSSVKLFDVGTGALERVFAARFVSLAPDRSLAVWLGRSAEVDVTTVWDLTDGVEVAAVSAPEPGYLGHACVAAGSGTLVARQPAERAGAIDIVDASTGQTVVTLGSDRIGADCRFVFSGDGRRLLVADARWNSGTVEQRLSLWDVASARALMSRTVDVFTTEAIQKMAFSPDGMFAVAADGDGILVLDAQTGRQVGVLEVPVEGREHQKFHLRTLQFSPDNRYLLACGNCPGKRPWEDGPIGTVCVWSMPRFELAEHRFEIHDTPLTRLACSADGTLITAAGMDGTDGRLVVWDRENERIVASASTGSGQIWDCTFSRDGSLLLIASQDGTVKLWDVDDMRRRSAAQLKRRMPLFRRRERYRAHHWSTYRHAEAVRSCQFFPAGQRLVSSAADGSLNICDWETATVVTAQHASYQYAIAREMGAFALSPDGTQIVFNDNNDCLALMDVDTDGNARRTRPLGTAKHRIGPSGFCGFTPDGERIVASCSDGMVRVWDRGREVEVLVFGQRRWMDLCSLSPDGRCLLAVARRTTIKLWDVWSGHDVGTFTGGAGAIRCFAFSPTGDRIAAGSDDGMLRVWLVSRRRALTAFAHGIDGVEWCAFTPDGTRVVSRASDGTVCVWNVARRSVDVKFILEARRDAARFTQHSILSPDGRLLASSADELVQVHRLATGEEICAYWAGSTVTCAAWNPDGRLLALGDGNGHVQILAMEDAGSRS